MKNTNETIELITLPTPYPVGPVNLYLLKEEPLTLIDAGPMLPDSEQFLNSCLNAVGYDIQDIKRLIITHAHPDHIGLASIIQRRSKAAVYLHKNEIEKISIQNVDNDKKELMFQAGIPAQVIAEIAQWSIKNSEDYVTQLDVDNLVPIIGNEIFTSATRELQVCLTPGHSSGHICLYDARNCFLFSGDHILADISPNPVIELAPDGKGRNKSLCQYLDSLNQISKTPLAKIYPGHGKPFNNYHEVVDRFYYYFRQREEAIYQKIDQQGKTAYEIADELYPKIKNIDVFLAVSRVIGHLDILVEDGRVQEKIIAGKSSFSLV